jgi:hypothetical protein
VYSFLALFSHVVKHDSNAVVKAALEHGTGEWMFWAKFLAERMSAYLTKSMTVTMNVFFPHTHDTAFFDTAEAYQSGRSEEALAVALKNASGVGKAIVTTKILPQNCLKIRETLEASLKRLGCEKVYLYQVSVPFSSD